jgi:hypothetical protein
MEKIERKIRGLFFSGGKEGIKNPAGNRSAAVGRNGADQTARKHEGRIRT